MSLGKPGKERKSKEAYTNILNDLKKFQDIDSLPVIVNFGCDETAGGKLGISSCVVV